MSVTEKSFLADVSKHEMSVKHNDGIYKHVVFRAPNSSKYWFEIVTWPGSLSINGDCGSFTFSRITNMVDFFCADNFDVLSTTAPNFGYWSNKCTASDTADGIREFDLEAFRENAQKEIESAIEHAGDELRAASAQLCRKVFFSRVVKPHFEFEWEARAAINSFEYESNGITIHIVDFYEHKCQKYSSNYEWCCYALAWACAKIKTLEQ